jgi:hypothetical protein
MKKLAASSSKTIEAFFREYLEDENFCLPEIYFYNGRIAGLITSGFHIGGITFGKRILIFPPLIGRNRENNLRMSADLLVHEITHVLQYKREGFLRFFYLYLKSYRQNLKGKKKWDSPTRRQAYLEIPLELEAVKTTNAFMLWKEKHKLIV